MKSLLVLTLALASSALPADLPSARSRVELGGLWKFFIDFPGKGESFGWQSPALDEVQWDTVEVPHIWSLEPRYEHTGPAWYRRRFVAPPLKPGQHARFLFGAVFYKSKVWLNGTLLGEHEGGYTAFELDAGPALKPGAENVLVVMADNSWSTETIPGSRVGPDPQNLTYPWWNYGGIKKPVYLEISDAVYVANQKITAAPDLSARTASVSVKVWVRNTAATPAERKLRIRLRRPGAWDPAASAATVIRIPPQSTAAAELTLTIPAAHLALWDFDHPNLYQSLVEIEGGDSHLARFGIRKLEIRDSRLLLNGEPVSFGGANRSADHPRFGSMETQAVIDQDLSMMKTANMGLARILHYPCSQTLLDWADEHGFLIIAEAGNWGLKPVDMDSEIVRANWKRQAREMIEQSWNHPSIVAWSAGNEYESDTPSGVRWTRDMIAFMRSLDDSRLTTFVSLGGKVFSKVKPEENSFHYADILCPNIYGNGNLARSLKTLQANWPGKPVLLSEFGWREDTAPSEEWRARQFREAIAILRKYPFVIGASVWSWNDYRSRHYGTNPDGYRHWGLVDPNRNPRGAYHALREEFSPVVISTASLERRPVGLSATYTVKVELSGRADFPSRILRDHEVVVTLKQKDGGVRKVLTQSLPVLKPGEKLSVVLPVSPFDIAASSGLTVAVRQPTGFISVEKPIPIDADAQ